MWSSEASAECKDDSCYIEEVLRSPATGKDTRLVDEVQLPFCWCKLPRCAPFPKAMRQGKFVLMRFGADDALAALIGMLRCTTLERVADTCVRYMACFEWMVQYHNYCNVATCLDRKSRSRFRVSPGAFFQTNTPAADTLFNLIHRCAFADSFTGTGPGDVAQLCASDSGDGGDPASEGPVLLDLCCGTGAIALTIGAGTCSRVRPCMAGFVTERWLL